MTNARPEEIGTGVVESVPGGHDHDSASHRQDVPAQLRRRRQASLRLEPLPDGRRDPWSPRRGGDQRDAELDAWVRALEHLRELGLAGLAPHDVQRALGRRSAA